MSLRMNESAELQESRKAIAALLQETDEEIAGTLTHLQRLKVRRMDILGDLNALDSPFLQLPPELICEIFLHALPPPQTIPSPKTAPLLLGQVCRRFRNISLSLPALWNSLSVGSVFSASPTNEQLAMLDLWLERAGDSTLSIHIVHVENENYPILATEMAAGRVRSQIYRKIRRSSHRWRKLEIVRRLEEFPALLHRDDPWNLPELVKLSLLLCHGGRHPTQYPPNMLSNLMDAPALREVHLMGFTPNCLLLPWGQLTTAVVENLLPIEFLQTLAQLTSLTKGTFTLWPTRPFHIPNHAPNVLLPRLTSLSLTGELCTPLLDYLDLPFLSHFHLALGPLNDAGPLFAFLRRGNPHLKSIALDARCALSPNDLVSLLDALSHVEVLDLSTHMGLMNGIFPRALGSLSTGSVLPNVRNLTVRELIDRYHEPPLDEATVVDMLKARWAGGKGALKRFCLVSTHVFAATGTQIHPGFSMLAKEGMAIELRSHGSGPFLAVYFKAGQQQPN
ncbi:hypothetical protein B0H16DRAFT_1432525 [Mycena metata]|uniref:F-box domain-containing protein n=1 Tax=Mycena metata TaxID=1033252 RepID=A0AAD7MJ37_9AGAR|nr:hypothetical protein B0H16DRAFT_1432525 [Mycena metata]